MALIKSYGRMQIVLGIKVAPFISLLFCLLMQSMEHFVGGAKIFEKPIGRITMAYIFCVTVFINKCDKRPLLPPDRCRRVGSMD